MKFDEFLKRVQSLTSIDSTGETMRAISATLEVLGQRLVRGEAEDLAAQLPAELQACLLKERGPQRFELDEFFRRIGEKEGIGRDLAEKHARVVLAMMTETVSSGEIKDVLSELPKEFHELFKPVSVGAA